MLDKLGPARDSYILIRSDFNKTFPNFNNRNIVLFSLAEFPLP